MQEKIKQHLDELFADAPKTRKAMELKEEMTRNTIDKYQDLISEGYQEDAAYQNVIGSIGDVTELFGDLEEKNLLTLSEVDRRKKALLTAIAVGLYIFAGVVLFGTTLLADYYAINNTLALVLAGLVCIPPTCMLVYASYMYPDYTKREESLVEQYKESRYSGNREKAVMTSISSIIWLLTLALYFLISFTSGGWHVTWVIFLIGGCIQAIVTLVYSLRRRN